MAYKNQSQGYDPFSQSNQSQGYDSFSEHQQSDRNDSFSQPQQIQGYDPFSQPRPSTNVYVRSSNSSWECPSGRVRNLIIIISGFSFAILFYVLMVKFVCI